MDLNEFKMIVDATVVCDPLHPLLHCTVYFKLQMPSS